MSSDVSNARGGKKTARREKNGEEGIFARDLAARENFSRASPTRR